MTISFPEWLEPMAATLTQNRFTGPEWIFERKFDGIRLIAFKRGSDVRLFSRNRLPQNIPAVVEAIANLPTHELILDGEVTWGHGKVDYHVFDIMWLDGRDVTSIPLDERRALLSGLPLRAPLQRVASLDDPKPWERACSEGWEGVIAKRRDSPYEHRRSPHWLKMKASPSPAAGNPERQARTRGREGDAVITHPEKVLFPDDGITKGELASYPQHLTQEFSKVDRGRRILVDTGRNGYSATFAAAYAVRAKPGAPVSAPCTWGELERGEVGPRTFTLRTMAGRVAGVGDLWSDMPRHRRSLRRPMEQLRRIYAVDG